MQARPTLEGGDEQQVIALIAERAEVAEREVEHGRVLVHVQVDEREELVEATLRQEDVTVERVPVDRPVDAPPPVREEDGVLVVPILEERLVVRTELFLKEELRITRTGRTESFRQAVRLRAERAVVSRADPGAGNQSDNPEG